MSNCDITGERTRGTSATSSGRQIRCRRGAAILLAGTALILPFVASAEEPIPEPDVVFIVTVDGLGESDAHEACLENDRGCLAGCSGGNLKIGTDPHVLRVRLVNRDDNNTSTPSGVGTVGDSANLLVNGFPQGSIELLERGEIYEVRVAQYREDLDTPPYPPLPQRPIGGGTGDPTPTTPPPTAGIATPTITHASTPTATSTPTPTPTPSSTTSPSATATPSDLCMGDCNDDGAVSVDELVMVLEMALGRAAPESCLPDNVERMEDFGIDDVVAAVDNALHGCPPESP